MIPEVRRSNERHTQPHNACDPIQGAQVGPGQRHGVQSCQSGCRSTFLQCQFTTDSAHVADLAMLYRQRSAQEQQVACLNCFHVGAERTRRLRQHYSQLLQTLLSRHYQCPRCDPPSTCNTSPVTWRACVRYQTASAISSVAATTPIGDRLCRKSCGKPFVSGVLTTPGATTFTRIPACAYSKARLREAALMPPLVIIATEACSAANGWSAMEAVMFTMLPPLFWANICRATSWVMKKNPSRFVDASARKSCAL